MEQLAFQKEIDYASQSILDHKICSRCIYDERVPKIVFDEDGVCNYCHMIDDLKTQFGTGCDVGHFKLAEIFKIIKSSGLGKRYDCVVGVSGGTDSSYVLVKAVEAGLRPLAVHYDNTWNTSIATQNIRNLLVKLNVDLYTHVVDNKESDDIFRSFFLANVPEIDGPTDIALAETLYRAAAKYGVKYILEGHSFVTEGVSPLATAYVDGRYISSIHREFGRMRMSTFPNMNFMSFMKWILFYRIKKIRPLWYIEYNKEKAQKMLAEQFGWKYYGGHHLENRMTAFNHSVYFPKKFGVDQRNNSLSASVRAGFISREDALNEYLKAPLVEPDLVEYFKKRLNFSDVEYEKIMAGPQKNFRDYKTYKKWFENLRPFFYFLAKANLVPMSFYIKYTSKTEM
jgi:N-acetyl sugar amidotransferase